MNSRNPYNELYNVPNFEIDTSFDFFFHLTNKKIVALEKKKEFELLIVSNMKYLE